MRNSDYEYIIAGEINMSTKNTEPKEWFQGLVDKYKDDSEFIAEGLLIEVTEQIHKQLQTQNISRSQLAQKLSCSPAYITKLLNGAENLTLKKLVQIAQALNCSFDFVLLPIDLQVKRYYTFAPKKLAQDGFNQKVQLTENYESNIPNAA